MFKMSNKFSFFLFDSSAEIFIAFMTIRKNRCCTIDQNFQSKSWKLASSKHEPLVKKKFHSASIPTVHYIHSRWLNNIIKFKSQNSRIKANNVWISWRYVWEMKWLKNSVIETWVSHLLQSHSSMYISLHK